MSERTPIPEVSQFSQLQQRISIVTWIITLLLSLRGLFAFYGMKDKGSFEQIVTFVTEPIVQVFQLGFLDSLSDIPGIAVLFATISVLLISYIIRFALHIAEVRSAKARELVTQYVVAVSS
jgi:succinate dehydrogenase hydrophobic anchor subunit